MYKHAKKNKRSIRRRRRRRRTTKKNTEQTIEYRPTLHISPRRRGHRSLIALEALLYYI